jgi:DNA-binding response OmpR family regulator
VAGPERILLVEGHEHAGHGELLAALAERGYDVRAAAAGEEIRDFEPDLVVIDLRDSLLGPVIALGLGLRGARGGPQWPESLIVDDIEVDPAGHTASRRGVPVALTATEFAILVTLMRDRGSVVAKAALVEQLWEPGRGSGNVVEVHVSSLRRKLERLGPRVIHTVRGVGYRM